MFDDLPPVYGFGKVTIWYSEVSNTVSSRKENLSSGGSLDHSPKIPPGWSLSARLRSPGIV